MKHSGNSGMLRGMIDRGPLKVALIYLLFGFVWIIGSDTLVLWIATTSQEVARLQTVKGWVYVLLTTFLVYGLMRLYSRQKNAVIHETIRSSQLLEQSLEQKKLLVAQEEWSVKVTPDRDLQGRISSTARDLCAAWATQLSGRVTYTDPGPVLTVFQNIDGQRHLRHQGK